MSTTAKLLGIMKPLGGGDPIPLRREDLIVGRRPTCDIRLDFENISGKHCQLRMNKGVWYVRDLNSTNGTTVNGQKIASEHSLMPDDELAIAGHSFMIDYDPIAPTQVLAANQVLEEEITEARPRHSLMELAGLESDDRPSRNNRAAERVARPAADDADFDDPIPANLPDMPLPKVQATDEDFFRMIQEDVEEAKPKGRSR